ncbi:hypothetical protein KGA66_19645 [Actinocrinis puniceicyclus]|uniref:Uncharacterized protein n=1 Tax=Actinocrinis puniceicyclus TaxID=977794 RepID=A0A8J8BDH9_9ACTN|nr:hypothetical protein [Actinocrinis puniceicyclus]MBS2965273.1 hypothetical protein [Actinocrinis puniceicyclus]
MAGLDRDRGRMELLTGEPGGREMARTRRVVPARLRRWFFSGLLMVSAVVVIMYTQTGRDVDVENMWAAAALALFVGGATARVWCRAADQGSQVLRWRRLHRRVFWRAGVVCLLAGVAALWLDAFWQWRADNILGGAYLPAWSADEGHAAFSRGLAKWLSLAAVPLVLVEPFAWLLWPRSLRAAVRDSRQAAFAARGGGRGGRAGSRYR